MPVKLNSKYVTRVCNDRLKRSDPTIKVVGSATGLLRNRNLLETTEYSSGRFKDGLLDAIQTALSASRSLLTSNGGRAQLLAVEGFPPYERFCVLLYISSVMAMLESLAEALSSTEIGEMRPQVDRANEQSGVRDVVKAVLKVADAVEDAEVTYLLGFSPREGGLQLYRGYVEWVRSLFGLHRIELGPRVELEKSLVQEATQRFDIWLSEQSEVPTWLRNYLAISAQERTAEAIQDNLASVHAALRDWREAQTQAAKKRKAAWQAYRGDLGVLPDAKGTMFGEEFGVRKVFIQPLASYRVAGSEVVKPRDVTDVGSLIGALISTRIPGDELILLCGGPGSGKSTLCRILASELAADPEIHPVFLRLRRLKEGSDILSFLERSLQQHGLIDRISDLKSIPNLVIILDGFDELVMASRPRLREFFNGLREDLSSGPLRNAKAIVSGRDTLFPGGAGLPYGSHVISLSSFDHARVVEWGKKWRQLHSKSAGANFHPEIFLIDGSRGPLSHLVSWPLTLHLVARVHTAGQLAVTEGSHADVEKAYLYRAILAQTAERQQDQVSGQHRFDPKRMREFLRSLAWEMYQRSRESLDLADVEPILGRFFKDRSESELAEHCR